MPHRRNDPAQQNPSAKVLARKPDAFGRPVNLRERDRIHKVLDTTPKRERRPKRRQPARPGQRVKG